MIQKRIGEETESCCTRDHFITVVRTHSVFMFACGLAEIFVQPWLLIARVSTEPFSKGCNLLSAVSGFQW